jgi:hypothetical protein
VSLTRNAIRVGQQFGKLTACWPVMRVKYGKQLWLVMCRCGEMRVCQSDNLRSGHTASCGCLIADRRSALSKTERQRTYAKQWALKHRCRVISARTRWHRLNPKARSAHKLVEYALKLGVLVKSETCEGCGAASELEGHHHNGYDKPLEVQWLCSPCHVATMNRPNARKLYCKRQHEFTPDNTYTDPTGKRYCKTCERIRAQRRRKRGAEDEVRRGGE